MKLFSVITSIAFLSLLIASCRKPKCDEDVPAIAYKSFQQYRDIQGKLLDTAKIVITFKDCDGDIGLEEADTLNPFNPSSKYYYNLVLQYFEMVNGSWVGCDTCFRYRLPKLITEGQSKILEGEIGLTIAPFYYDFMSPDSDTIKYAITLYDRELHESNKIETPVIFTK